MTNQLVNKSKQNVALRGREAMFFQDWGAQIEYLFSHTQNVWVWILHHMLVTSWILHHMLPDYWPQNFEYQPWTFEI